MKWKDPLLLLWLRPRPNAEPKDDGRHHQEDEEGSEFRVAQRLERDAGICARRGSKAVPGNSKPMLQPDANSKPMLQVHVNSKPKQSKAFPSRVYDYRTGGGGGD